ncbi:MAG: hypothetical protein AB1750_11760 [Chloroflexota bacterium]
MNPKPARLLLFFLLAFSLPALACNAVTSPIDSIASTATALDELISTSIPDVDGIEETAAAAITEIGGDDLLTSIPDIPTDIFDATPPPNIPIIEGATDMISMAGVITYTSPLSFEDTKKFYLDEAPKQGWTYDDDSSMEFGSTAILSFYNNDNQDLEVMIIESGGQVTVTITYTS